MYHCSNCYEDYKDWRRVCGAEICGICVEAAHGGFYEHEECEYRACKGKVVLSEDGGIDRHHYEY